MRRVNALVVLLALSTTPLFGIGPLRPGDEPAVREPGQIRRHMILTPTAPLTEADRAELAANGVEVQRPLTRGRYLARVSGAAITDDRRIASVEPLGPAEKLHQSALRELAGGRRAANVHVVFHQDVPFEEATRALIAAGAEITTKAGEFLPSSRIDARVSAAALQALAADERVFGITGAPRFKVAPDNATSASLSKVNEVHAAPYGLTGAGVVVSLFELGRGQSTHPEFGTRYTLLGEDCAPGPENNTHGTHVAGTIAASGVDPRAKGMAPAVQIYQLCVDTPDNWLLRKKNELSTRNVVADNNSWGFVLGWRRDSASGEQVWNDYAEYYGAYDLTAGAPLDKISNEKNILFVHSAGNDGSNPTFPGDEFKAHRHLDAEGEAMDKTKKYCISKNQSGTDCPPAPQCDVCESKMHHLQAPFDTMGLTASAKNLLAVGNLFGSSASNAQIAPSSSRGPAKDGRVKPDVVARGTNVFSTYPTSTYESSSGTSMATPAVTGIVALLTEQWRKTNGGASPLATQLRTLVIAGTDDLGNPGPDYTYGFGLVNAKKSVDLILADEGLGKRVRTLSVGQGQQFENLVNVTNTQNLRVVVSWPDPDIPYLGNDDIADKALVNDIDVRVIAPNGQIFLPWTLDKVNYQANATTGVNDVDNTEMVEIPNAAPGTYRVVVSGTTIAQGPQQATLIANALLAPVAPPCIDATEVLGNNSAAGAYGNLVGGQRVFAGICSSGDVDFFKFVATKSGSVSVVVSARDTAVRATLSGAGSDKVLDVGANATATITASTSSAPAALTLKIEANGEVTGDSTYNFVPTFGESDQDKRRAVRRR